MPVARRRAADAKTPSRGSLTTAWQRTVTFQITRSTASPTFPPFLSDILGMVPATLEIRAPSHPAGGRIPTIAYGMTGSMAPGCEQRVAMRPSTFPSCFESTLGMVHAILGIRAHPDPAGGRIPTIARGMTGSMAARCEQRVAMRRSTFPSCFEGMLGMVHAILGIRARPDPADGRIPTIACGMTGSMAARCEHRVAMRPSTFPSYIGGILGMVHEILGIRARPDPAGGRIPTIACGIAGSMAARCEQRVASGVLANRPGFFGSGALHLHRRASLQHQGAR